ncbi:hypothetical protein CDD81_3998 [Ophiocordyceps australis]|uniref:Uncharacterized protein n=1 Tax=Ophiocordyceps australis TaxID=1399860 RepID=A0A2C5YAJ9_9HYPO|nr:hypothetical protein CDD81_3998 [Ophiocordyceps australis]
MAMPGQLHVPLPQASTANSPLPSPRPSSGIVVFSGGSAANSLVDVFERVREANRGTLSYVLPISDNGGSSSEIIRVFGGPGIGDVRSRLVRLIPDDIEKPETAALKALFNHRLPASYPEARAEWFDIVDGTHALWNHISSPRRELIRSILNTFNLEVVKRMRPSSRFDFSRASIGNLFLTGGRLFSGSFEAAILLLSSICAIPDRIAVIPALNGNFAHHIAAGLADGSVITGQNDISHPSAPTAAVPGTGAGVDNGGHDTEEHDKIEDANLPGTLPALRRPAIDFSKHQEEDLPARIDRIWYINPYGQEIRIPANPRVIDAIESADTVVYSIGSLFTSLMPNLVLKGVGQGIASPLIRNKILVLNATNDRETGPSTNAFSALDFVAAIAHGCAYSRGTLPICEHEYALYVTHVIHIDGPAAPQVDKARFSHLGIETTRLYGPRGLNGNKACYDMTALAQTLESIVGRKDLRTDRSRRNTLTAKMEARSGG